MDSAAYPAVVPPPAACRNGIGRYERTFATTMNHSINTSGVINAALIKFTFNTMLKKRAYTQEGITQLVAQSKFQHGDLRLEAIGFELTLRKPESNGGVR